MKEIIIDGIRFTYKSDRGNCIIVYNESGEEIGRWDNEADLRYDVENNPEDFKNR